MPWTASTPVLRGNLRISMVDMLVESGKNCEGSELLAVKVGGCDSSDRSDDWRSDRRGIAWGCETYADLDVLEPKWSRGYEAFGGDVVLEPKLVSWSISSLFFLLFLLVAISNSKSLYRDGLQVLICKPGSWCALRLTLL